MWATSEIEYTIGNTIVVNYPINLSNVIMFNKNSFYHHNDMMFIIEFRCLDSIQRIWNFNCEEDRDKEYDSLLIKIKSTL